MGLSPMRANLTVGVPPPNYWRISRVLRLADLSKNYDFKGQTSFKLATDSLLGSFKSYS